MSLHFSIFKDMDRSAEEAGLSVVPPTESMGPSHFRDIVAFSASNNRSQLREKDIENLYSRYTIP